MEKKFPKISIIVPILNEADYIGKLLSCLQNEIAPEHVEEILVIDGGSTDSSLKIAEEYGATIVHSEKGRAKQMNLGAQMAKAEILYFLHADTLPPKNFVLYILEAVKGGFQAGCFQMQFDSNSRFLKFFAWFTRINHQICRGGDQSLFVTKRLFQNSKGFNEDYKIYEDNEFIGRLYKKTKFKVLPLQVKTSARRYDKVGAIRLQYHFGVIHLKNYLGAGPDQLYDYYKRKIPI
ncbi:TIGR04283 family arsenosugar biosynthesis glycosyltransferase [Ulvibacterium marinum]|uniref:Glycosyltransferase n=1 Tax=Ulvibacterium marinum TaxID=2419782 RepID=A0A3B0CBP0_9FLAO|nr:TIGR04283 family arsenosugar biosynthesis glycosyltransferase [Ulvibacterium marinum]RKN83313.1 glycosyltransferase [Ulvibacterium marinum]